MFNFPDNFKLIFRFVHGSHLYGTSTPKSDLDIRGVFIPSREYFFGFSKKVEQFECKEPDITYFEMRKFLSLALDCNPNIIEFLFVEPDTPIGVNGCGNVPFMSPEWNLIREHRQYFLSTKARWTFSGYAVSQLHRLKKHRNWLIYGENITEPRREDYGLPVNRKLISSDQIGAFNVVVANRLEEIAQLHEFKDQLQEMQVTVDYIGLVQSMMAKKSTTEVISLLPEIKANFIYAIQKEKEYAQDKKEYDQYLNWKKTRNLARYELEEKYKYDCYANETEFLTENGWKVYNDIKNDKLGTLNPNTFEIEYQDYTNRVKYPVKNEELMYFSNQYSQFFVTKNHNCFVSKAHRNESNRFSFKYDKNNAKWEFKPINIMLNERHSHYHIIHSGYNKNKEFNVTDDYLKIMGLYTSEGSLIKGTKNKIRGISLSQLNGSKNKILKILNTIKEFEFATYTHYRKSKNRKEDTYNFYNKKLGNNLLVDCCEQSKNKTLPNWIIYLSKRQCDILLSSLIAGDGSIKKYSNIYYTSSKNLADMVNILALTAGYITKVWYYPQFDNMYQVYIDKKNKQFGNFRITTGKYSHFKPIKYTGNVVCFEVPNSILITRYKGEVAFQGNTKHAAHCYRLITEGEELLKTGTITFPRPDRELLTAIRNGCWTFDEMMEKVGDVDKVFDELYKLSPLPKKPDRQVIDDLCCEITDRYIKGA